MYYILEILQALIFSNINEYAKMTSNKQFYCSKSNHDTVGACALDNRGSLACATSTGGITAKQPGRVGDSPIIGL
jgi:isoaspartyl peptidase/L-asparaginase-like protein (Ntn-hydrolase superfamily)